MKNKQNVKLPVIDFEICVLCKKCIESCPLKAIIEPMNTSCAKCIKYCLSMAVPCKPDNLIFNYELCDECGQCVTECPENAIYWFYPAFAVMNES